MWIHRINDPWNGFQRKKCKALGCNCKKLIRLVQMRLHVVWHIMHGLTADPHRCGYCGLIGWNVSLVKTSSFGEKANYGPESDCVVNQIISLIE